MVQHQDNTEESRLEEWSLVQLKKGWVGVKKTRACFSQRVFQQRVKHLHVEIRENTIWTEK